MAFQLFNLPPQQPLSAAGRVLPGSKLSFFLTTTDTPTPVYTTSALSTTHTQPIEADAGGRFASVYLDPTITYKATVTDANDVLLYTVDPVNDQLLSQSVIGGYLFPRTTAETSAGVTPTLYYYAPGDVRRYGAEGDGIVDCSDAFQDAVDQFDEDGAAVYVPCGTWRVETTITGVRGLILYGDSRLLSIVLIPDASGQFLTFTGTLGHPDGGSISISDLTIKGTSGSGNLVELTLGGQSTFTNVRFWLTGAAHVALVNNTHNVAFYGCLFQGFKDAGVISDSTTGPVSIIRIENCECNLIDADGVTPNAGAALAVLDSGEQLTLVSLNVNGGELLPHVARFTGEAGRINISEVYAELLTGQAVLTDSGVVLNGCKIENCQLSTVDSISIDLSAGNPAHNGVIVKNIRRPETGAVYVASFGSGIIDFDYAGIVLDGSADHVFGHTGFRAVRKYADGRVERNGKETHRAFGATSVADGGTIAHTLSSTPTRVNVTASVASEFVSVTAIGATTFTCAIKTHDNSAGTTQTVYWEAEY